MKIGDTLLESPQSSEVVDKKPSFSAIANERVKALEAKHSEEKTDEQKQLEALDPETRKFVEDNQGIGGTLRVGAESAGNELLFGLPEMAYKAFADPKDVEQHEALKNFHQTANVVGGLAGAVGSLALGGGLFKAATTAGRLAEGAVIGGRAAEELSLARAIASKVVGGAAEGAVIGAPRSAGNLIFDKDPKEAAENLVFSAGIGGLIGPASFGLKKAVSTGAELVGEKLAGVGEKIAELSANSGEKLAEGARDKITDYLTDGIKEGFKGAGLVSHGLPGLVGGKIAGAAASVIAKKVVDLIPEEAITRGLQATLKANQLAEKQIAKIPDILETLSTGKFSKVTAVPSAFGLLGKEFAKEADEYKQFKLLSEKLAANSATQNDQKIIGTNAGALNHNTDIQTQYSLTALNAVNYLQSIMPKDPNPPQAFAKSSWKPNEEQLQNFHSQVQIVNNPYIVLDKLKEGTLTKADVDTVKAVYPAIYAKITQNILKHAASDKYSSIPYSVKAKLSVMLGTPLDNSFKPENIKSYQNVFANSAADENKSQKSSAKALSDFDTGSTEINKIASNGTGNNAV